MDIRTRQDSILRTLRRNGTSTVELLAEQVSASRRTVLRDISALRDQGYVIYSEVGRGGGLQLDPQSLHRGARLTVSEVFALIVTVSAAQMAEALPFSGVADAGLAKIEKSLPADQLRDLRRLLDGLHVGKLSPLQDLSDTGRAAPELLDCFERAFLEQKMMRFRYRDAKGRETIREVEPQAMLILPPLWYMVSWDSARDGFRHFRMDRISQPTLLDHGFRRRHVPFEEDVCPYAQLEQRAKEKAQREAVPSR